MSSSMVRVVLAVAVVAVTAVASLAQQTTTSTETKAFEVLAVDGNQLVVRLPEGTRELTVPADFRFMVDGQSLSVGELKVGMKGTATITTRTTVTPVTVTEVKNGTVMKQTGSSIIVRTDEGIRSFTQGEIDKRGVKIVRGGKPAQVSDFREGDRLTATIITSKPPQVVTDKEVLASLAAAKAAERPPAATTGQAQTGAAAAAAAATGPSDCRDDAAQDRQLVAPPRAREYPFACVRASAYCTATLRPLDDSVVTPGCARWSIRERGPPSIACTKDSPARERSIVNGAHFPAMPWSEFTRDEGLTALVELPRSRYFVSALDRL